MAKSPARDKTTHVRTCETIKDDHVYGSDLHINESCMKVIVLFLQISLSYFLPFSDLRILRHCLIWILMGSANGAYISKLKLGKVC